MWNERFAGTDYVFGTEPADFLRRTAPLVPPGSRVLAVADGEGRNSVHLAGLGHQVVAMDASEVGLQKARRLAETRGVAVDYRLADIAAWDWAPGAFDAVVAVFIQFAGPALRDRIFAGMVQTLRPGGLLLLHGYTPGQLAHGTGGPRALENLYTEALLAEAFKDLQIQTLHAYEAELSEGAGHHGTSALIDLVARKPA